MSQQIPEPADPSAPLPPPPPSQPQPQRYGPGPAYPPPQVTNPLAVASLVLGIVGMFLFVFFMVVPILALVFGLVATGQIRREGHAGAGMATAGIVLGSIGIALFLLLVSTGGYWHVNVG